MLTSALYHPGVLINKYGVLALAWDDTQALSCVQFGVDDDVDNADKKVNDVNDNTKIMIIVTVNMEHFVVNVPKCFLVK